MAYNIRFLIFPPDSLPEGVVSKKDNSISGPVARPEAGGPKFSCTERGDSRREAP